MGARRRSRRLAEAAALVAALLPACAGESEDAGASSDAIIGGTETTPEAFPSTVYLRDGCTAAKVAPKTLLTAAHCMFDTFDSRVRFQEPGATLAIARDPSKGYVELPVASVHVHETWVKECTERYCGASVMTARIDAADVAVVELARDLEGVPVATIDPTPLVAGDRVVIVGFGCTEGVYVDDRRKVPSLAWAESKIAPPSQAVHQGSPVVSEDEPVYSGNYALTLGPGAPSERQAAAICPGDSGGPLYRRRSDGGVAVVGVNSNYTFWPDVVDPLGLPVTSWHTRLDDASRHHIAAWLRERGIVR